MLKIIDNFTGALTRDNIGDLNSGLAKYETTFGSNPFTNPGNLTWFEQPTSILTDFNNGIAAARVRLENNVINVYAINSAATLYKIQVNDVVGLNPDYDHPSVIGAVPAETSSAIGTLYGSSLQFYGATSMIYMGLDERIEKINFDGSGATKVTAISSVTTNVPRPSAQFLGKMYWGNGTNLIEIDSTGTVTSYAKLQPGFPSDAYIRDLDVSPDGNYLQITVSKNNSPILFQPSTDSKTVASSEAYKFFWNGTDPTYSAYETYPGYSLTANTVFGQKNYTLGTDLNGTALYSGSDKIMTLPKLSPPNFAATYSTGNLLGLATTEYASSVTGTSSTMGLVATGMVYGQYDNQIPNGLFRMFRQQPASLASNTQDISFVPVCLPVSNLAYTYKYAGYSNNIIGSSKIYFSTSEIVSPTGGSTFKLYKFTTSPVGTGTAIGGVYETQQETSFKLFRSTVSKKFKVTQVRFFTEPLVANNSFKIDLIGSNGNPMSGGSATFTVGSNGLIAGTDIVQYTPATAPTYSVGVRITNLGTVNWVGVKLELEFEEAGIL